MLNSPRPPRCATARGEWVTFNLFINDLDRSVEFYTKICGFEITALETKIGAGFFSNGNTHHDIGVVEVKNYEELAKTRHGETSARGYVAGLNHFGWEMANQKELVDAHFRAIEVGIEPRVTDQGTSPVLHSSPPWTPGDFNRSTLWPPGLRMAVSLAAAPSPWRRRTMT